MSSRPPHQWLEFSKRLFVRLSVIFTTLVLMVTITPIVPWCVGLMTGPMNDPDGDVLIVLTADQQSDGLIGNVSFTRAIYAVRAWRSGHFRAMVISGGIPRAGEGSLASSMAEFISGYGVPKDKIFLEERSTTTRENALYTKKMVESWPGKKVLLSGDLHMFRARRVFEVAGLHVEPRPFPHLGKYWSSPIQRVPLTYAFLQEITKIGYYWVRGWIHLP